MASGKVGQDRAEEGGDAFDDLLELVGDAFRCAAAKEGFPLGLLGFEFRKVGGEGVWLLWDGRLAASECVDDG